MSKLIFKLECRIKDTLEFWQNFTYYIGRGHKLRAAWDMAHRTL